MFYFAIFIILLLSPPFYCFFSRYCSLFNFNSYYHNIPCLVCHDKVICTVHQDNEEALQAAAFAPSYSAFFSNYCFICIGHFFLINSSIQFPIIPNKVTYGFTYRSTAIDNAFIHPSFLLSRGCPHPLFLDPSPGYHTQT
jgi:hypothetical protein